MNRIDQAFASKENLLNVYFTAGFPNLEDTVRIARDLENAGTDIIELGLPYSDPIADGPTIQQSSMKAINNGMTIEKLFSQLQDLRKELTIPVILMGYLNPVIQYGIERFCEQCQKCGIDGLILPDLPMQEYLEVYQELFRSFGLYNIYLVTPQTSVERIRTIDQETSGFIYLVSSASITGAKKGITPAQIDYFERINGMDLNSKTMIGFGISDHQSFATACKYADGAIIGSAFIRQLEEDASTEAIHKFIANIKNPVAV
jgi:tryptophan synthase alpha chain